MIRWLLLLTPLAVAFAFSGCETAVGQCEDNLNCEIYEVCQAGRCLPRVCVSSADCPIQHFCNDQTGSCTPGCQLDRDCLPNEICDDGTCEPAGCRDTNLDCPMGHFCNSITGECFQAGGFFCQPCSGQGDSECGSSRNFCVRYGGNNYCGVDCSNGQQCPRGYDCLNIIDSGNNVIGRNCMTACWLLE